MEFSLVPEPIEIRSSVRMEAKAVSHNLANPYEGVVRASRSSLRHVAVNTVSCRVCAPCVGWRNLKLRESHGTRWFWHTNGTHEFLCATFCSLCLCGSRLA